MNWAWQQHHSINLKIVICVEYHDGVFNSAWPPQAPVVSLTRHLLSPDLHDWAVGGKWQNKTEQIGKYFMWIHYVLVHTHCKVLKLNHLRVWIQWSLYLNGWLWIHGSLIINVTLTASAPFFSFHKAYIASSANFPFIFMVWTLSVLPAHHCAAPKLNHSVELLCL